MANNIARLGDWVTQAAQQGAQFITTPENCFLMDEPAAQRTYYTQENHPGIMAAQGWAKQFHVWILLGSVAVLPSADVDSKKQLNRSLLINPHGKIVTMYDKIHLFDVDVPNDRRYAESDRFSSGDKAVVASMADGWKLGMTICYDVRFPHLYRMLAQKGANIMVVPAAFTAVTGEAHWHVLLRARAIENGCYIVAPAQTGTHPGNRKTYGHSLIVDPWGRVIADGGVAEGMVMASLDVTEVEKTRARLPSLSHDKDFKI
jgi:predicted amidohydrolase